MDYAVTKLFFVILPIYACISYLALNLLICNFVKTQRYNFINLQKIQFHKLSKLQIPLFVSNKKPGTLIPINYFAKFLISR